MKRHSALLVVFLSIVLGTYLQAESFKDMPKETAILQLPDHSETNWKEITHYADPKGGLVEAIPLSQTASNWTELVAIQYINCDHLDKTSLSLDKIVESLERTVFATHPPGTVFWNIIEKRGRGVTYEWALDKDWKNIPAQHEVARAFLTPSGFHRVGFTRKNGRMSSDERDKWIRLLRENASVVPFQEGEALEGLSMADRLQASVSLGDPFHEWQVLNHYLFETGGSLLCYISPATVGCSYIAECLEITTMPTKHSVSLLKLVAAEKEFVEHNVGKKVEFYLLEQSPTEISYGYCHPKDHVQLNSIVRAILTDRGYYTINYRNGLDRQVPKEEMLAWLEQLKAVRVR